MTSRLVRVSIDTTVGTQRIDATISDVLGLQADIAFAVADALRVTIDVSPAAALRGLPRRAVLKAQVQARVGEYAGAFATLDEMLRQPGVYRDQWCGTTRRLLHCVSALSIRRRSSDGVTCAASNGWSDRAPPFPCESRRGDEGCSRLPIGWRWYTDRRS